MDRKEYMREYKRRYRAAKQIDKQDGDGFLSLSCLPVEEADKRGRGDINGWALIFENGTDILTGKDLSSLLTAFNAVKTKNTVYVCNLKVWGRFFLVEAGRRGLTLSDSTAKKNTYKVSVNATGDWLGFEINLDGNRTFIKSFSEIIRVPLNKAFFDFCGQILAPDADNDQIAAAMKKIMIALRQSLKRLSGGIAFKANTISGLSQKFLEIIAGNGCPEYGRELYKKTFPPLEKEIGDELRAAKVYRSGWNWLNPDAKEYTGDGYVLDVHSFYPSIYSEFLPFGKPERMLFYYTDATYIFEDEDPDDYRIYKIMELFATLKDGGVPTIQIINETGTEYLTEINYNEGEPFFLDTFDIMTLEKNYNVRYLTVEYCYRFKEKRHDFLQYFVEKLYREKDAGAGTAQGATAKYLLNSLSGRFGINSYQTNVDILKNKSYTGEKVYVGERGYLPAAIYINSKGRYLISTLAQKCYGLDIFLYSDTDSIIIKGDDIPKFLRDHIGDGLGQLSVKRFTESRFFGQKCYGLKYLDGWKWTVAGASPAMLKELGKDVEAGQVLKGGVVPKVYPNGTIAFKEREFTIARNMIF